MSATNSPRPDTRPDPGHAPTPDHALAQARTLFSLLSTPKLQAGLGRRLVGTGEEADPSVAGPLRALPWLSPDGAVDAAAVRAVADSLTALRADGAVLDVGRLERLPGTDPARADLARRVVGLVWERLGSPRSVTEPELGAALAMLVADTAQVRRDAVDSGVLRRSPDGARYELAG